MPQQPVQSQQSQRRPSSDPGQPDRKKAKVIQVSLWCIMTVRLLSKGCYYKVFSENKYCYSICELITSSILFNFVTVLFVLIPFGPFVPPQGYGM